MKLVLATYRPQIGTREELCELAAFFDPTSDRYRQIQSALLSNSGRAFFVDPATNLKYSLFIPDEQLLGGQDADEFEREPELPNLAQLKRNNWLLRKFITDANRVRTLSAQGNVPAALIVGRTGIGKSAVTDHLLGVDLESHTDNLGEAVIRVRDNYSQPYAEINMGLRANATGVNIFSLRDMILIDCPGSRDNSGDDDADVKNDIATTLVAKSAGSARIVYAMPLYSLTRAALTSPLPEFFTEAVSVYNDYDACPNSLLLLYINRTHRVVPLTTIVTILQDVVNELRGGGNADSNQVETFGNIASSAREHLQIADPLLSSGEPNVENRQAILASIRQLAPIPDPSRVLCTMNPPNRIFEFLSRHLLDIIIVMKLRISRHDACVKRIGGVNRDIDALRKQINQLSNSLQIAATDKQSEITKHRQSIDEITEEIRTLRQRNFDLNHEVRADENALFDNFTAKENDEVEYQTQAIHQQSEELTQLQLATAGLGLGAAAGALSRNGVAGLVIAVLSASAAAIRGQIPICRKTYSFNPEAPILRIAMDPLPDDSRWRNKRGGESKNSLDIDYYCTPDQPAHSSITVYIRNKNHRQFIEQREAQQNKIAGKKREISANTDRIQVLEMSIAAAEQTIDQITSDLQPQLASDGSRLSDLMRKLIELENLSAALEKIRRRLLDAFKSEMDIFASISIIKQQIMDVLCTYPLNNSEMEDVRHILDGISLYDQFVLMHNLASVPELIMPVMPFTAPAVSVVEQSSMATFKYPGIFSMMPVPSDGNCLFSAISDQLTRINYQPLLTHVELRQRVVEYMRAHLDQYGSHMRGGPDAYLERMSRDGAWGSELEIKALEAALQLRIQIIIRDDYCISASGDDSSPLIYLAYNGAQYYHSLVPTTNIADYSEHFKMTVFAHDGDSLLHSIAHQLLLMHQQYYSVGQLRRIVEDGAEGIENPLSKLAQELKIYIHVVKRVDNNDVYLTYGQISNPDVYVVSQGDNYYNSLVPNRWIQRTLEEDLGLGRQLSVVI